MYVNLLTGLSSYLDLTANVNRYEVCYKMLNTLHYAIILILDLNQVFSIWTHAEKCRLV